MSSWVKAYINQLVTAVFFIALLIYFVNHQDALKGLLAVPLWIVAIQLMLKASRVFATGLFTKFTLVAFSKKLSIKETNYLSLLSSLGNFFGPILGGASIRALYLKKKYDFEYSKFISTLYGFYVVSFATNALFGIILLLSLLHSTDKSISGFATVLTVMLVIFLGNVALMLLPSRFMYRIVKSSRILPERLIAIVNNMVSGWETIRINRPLLARLFLLNIVITGIASVESYLLYFVFVEEFTLISVLLYTIIGAFSVLVSLTPGAMGIKEGIYLFTSSIVLLTPQQVLQMATIDRSVTFLLLFISFVFVKIIRLDKKFAFNEVRKRGEA